MYVNFPVTKVLIDKTIKPAALETSLQRKDKKMSKSEAMENSKIVFGAKFHRA